MRFIFLLFFVSIFHGEAFAQSYSSQCIEMSPQGNFHCRLKPDGFSDWIYGTGIGKTSQTQIGAAEETMIAYFRDADRVCNVRYRLGVEKVEVKDGFIYSNSPIITAQEMVISWGILNEKNECGVVADGAFLSIIGNRRAVCGNGSELPANIIDINSYACLYGVIDVPVVKEVNFCGLGGNPIYFPGREKVDFEQMYSDARWPDLSYSMIYRSHRSRNRGFWFDSYFSGPLNNALDAGWVHNHDVRLNYAIAPHGEGAGNSQQHLEIIRIQVEDGSFRYFHKKDSSAQLYSSGDGDLWPLVISCGD